MDRNRCVGVSAGIQKDPGLCEPRFLYPIHEFSLAIGLFENQPHLRRTGFCLEGLLDVLQRHLAIGFGFPRPEQVEIGSIENVDGFCHVQSGVKESVEVRLPFTRATSDCRSCPLNSPSGGEGKGQVRTDRTDFRKILYREKLSLKINKIGGEGCTLLNEGKARLGLVAHELFNRNIRIEPILIRDRHPK